VRGPSSSQSRWTERFPVADLGIAGDLLVAVAATLIASLGRWAIDGHLPPGFPFLTFFPIVILIAFTIGTRAGALTAILSGLVAWYWFLPPVGAFVLTHTKSVALIFYAGITTTEVVLVHWMQRANRLLIAEREANLRLADTRELLFRELQHRVSNNLQMVAAMLTVQRKQLEDPAAGAALDEAARRLQTIGKISRQLYDPAGDGRAFGSFLDELARDVIETSSNHRVQHRVVASGDTRIQPEAAIPLALVVAESIANAIEHGFDEDQKDRQLEIRVAECPHQRVAIEIQDNGRGLPEDFNLSSSTSLGLRIATMLAGQLGGTFTLSPAPGRGALARLELPVLR
jgi:two-component sensor histidine kinase